MAARYFAVQIHSVKKIKANSELQKWLQSGAVKLLDSSATNQPSKKSNNKRNSQTKAVLGANPFSELAADPKFEDAEMLVSTGTFRDGTILVKSDETPLVIEAARGRGRMTLLTFSAEREPFLSWKNRPWFWAKVSDIPVNLYQSSDYNYYGGHSIDCVFGTMIDSKQVRKLPLAWLLLLLVVYLLVIGPFDRFWLKKINRQMLTWITFPAYVLIFSGLIYFIGFQLRAGDSEFNELHLVDIFPRNDKAVLRGHTYASIYSPANKTYRLVGEQPAATLRGEFMFSYGGAEESSRANVIHRGNNFIAEVSVPVWTSQLFVSDWLQSSDLPLKISAIKSGTNWEVTVENKLDRKLSEARVVILNRVYLIGDLAARQARKVQIEWSKGINFKSLPDNKADNFFKPRKCGSTLSETVRLLLMFR